MKTPTSFYVWIVLFLLMWIFACVGVLPSDNSDQINTSDPPQLEPESQEGEGGA